LGLGVNRLQQRIWDFLRWARIAWCTDMFGSYASSAGLEARYPFLDVRLVQFVLSVPPEQRLLGDLRRTLHRDAMSGVVPPGIATRSSKAIFDGAISQWGHRCQSEIRQILEDPQWRSEAFVDQASAREQFHRLISRPASHTDFEGWLGIRSIVHVETWLRAVFQYPHKQENLPMSEIGPEGEAKAKEVSEVSQEAYVPPLLTHVGNVRDLLAGGSSPGPDGLVGGEGLA
jgi:asparagine synthetase B (glutamine-hydrolysing)